MANLCDCPELNYIYVTDDEYGCGIKMYFEHTDSEVYINVDAYYDFNCGIEPMLIPIKCCPFCGKNFS